MSNLIENFFNTLIFRFVNAFVYFGLSLNTNNLGGNPFINFLLAGAVEIPAHTLNLIVVKFGRRLPFAVATFGGGFGCLAAAIFLYGIILIFSFRFYFFNLSNRWWQLQLDSNRQRHGWQIFRHLLLRNHLCLFSRNLSDRRQKCWCWLQLDDWSYRIYYSSIR